MTRLPPPPPPSPVAPCPHASLAHDDLSNHNGIFRLTAGDCYCLQCRRLVPYLWNGGRPRMVEEVSGK